MPSSPCAGAVRPPSRGGSAWSSRSARRRGSATPSRRPVASYRAGNPVGRCPLPYLVSWHSARQLVAQHPLEHLARWITRERLTHEKLTRDLEPAEMETTVALELVDVETCAGLQHDRGHHALAPAGIRHADHGRLADLRQLVDDALDLGRRDVLAAADDHVLLAVGQVQETVVVEMADVARAEPLAEEAGRRLLR